MIRVLHSVSNMDRAGIETMVMNFYRNVDRSVVQFDFLANKKKPGAYEDEIEEMGGRVFRSPGFNPLKFPRYVSFLRSIFKDYPEKRVLHVHNGALGLYPLVAGAIIRLRNRVYHAHGTQLPSGRGRVVKAICKPFIDCFATYRLACGTMAARFYYHRSTIKNNRYIYIHNAIDIDRFSFDEKARADKRGELGFDGCDVIGHIGRFSAQKNHERLLRVFKRVYEQNPKARLVLIGEGETWSAVERLKSELGLNDVVHMAGSVSKTELWYQAMDLFLLPSIWEGLPVVAIEAQASGLPCVISNSVTDECDVTGRVSFLDLSSDDDTWAREINALLANRLPRADAAELVRKAGYDIVQEAKKLQDFYVEICGGI